MALKGRTMHKLKTVLIFLIPILVLTLLCTYSIFSKRIEKNPSGTVGNTAGNLNNGGLFCEDEGIVYFSNPYDNGCLYSMKPEETEVRKISDSSVCLLNAAGRYLYFYEKQTSASDNFTSIFRANGIYRLGKDGKGSACLKRTPTPYLALCDNTLFYQASENGAAPVLSCIDIDRKNPAIAADFSINPACIEQGLIYFGGTGSDHHLYTLDPADHSIQSIYAGDLYSPIVWGDYVYYMDISSDYRLCRYSMTEQSIEVLTEDRLDFFNIADDMIYYQKSSAKEPALKRMYLDGSQNEIVAYGVYEHINATSEYVYFNAYDVPSPMYRTPLHGAVNVTAFSAAAQAALNETK